MFNRLDKLTKRVVDYLGIELIPIEFDDTIEDDSRLTIRPKFMILINGKFQDDYF